MASESVSKHVIDGLTTEKNTTQLKTGGLLKHMTHCENAMLFLLFLLPNQNVSLFIGLKDITPK